MSILLIIAITGLVFGVWLYTGPVIYRHGRPLRSAPDSLPFAGNGILFLQDRHRLFQWFVKCERMFGFETFSITVPSLPPGVVINDPRNLEFVLKNEDIFSKGDFFKRRSWDLFGNGIINADGELWKVQRKAGLHFLSISNLKLLTEVALPKYLNAALESLTASDGQLVDLEITFHELTTRLMGQMAYGMEMHASDTFSKSFDYASGMTGERFQNPLWTITERYTGHGFRRAIAEVKDFGSRIVNNAVKNRSAHFVGTKRPKEDAVSGSLINSLLDTIEDHQMVADAALNYLSAGRDTTAQALTWTFYLLMRHPDVLSRLRQEIRTNNQAMTYKCPYTMAIFYEALRLYPPVPFEIKQCEEKTILPDGTELPRSAIVFWSIWAMNRSELIWGTDSESFRPERWLVGGRFTTRTAFEFPVFNGGSRTCLGKKMAESIALMVISKFVGCFDFECIDGKERISKNSLTLPMKDGLPCIVRKRTRRGSLVASLE